MLRVLPAIHVHTVPVFRIAFDPGEAQGHAPIRIRAAESASVAPRGIQVIVRPPRDRPQIASRCRSDAGLPMPGNALNHRTVRIRWVR
jgi:hypothetical protein